MSTRVIATVLGLLALPLTLIPIEAVSFHIRYRSNGVIVSSGDTREYSLYVPRTYDGARATPLVISLHGAALWGSEQERLSGWDAVAERENVIVVYPTGAPGHGPRIFHADAGPGLAKDVRFVADLIDELERRYRIDRHRIYVNGLSNGGGMAFVLSCAMPDRIAAVGLVASAQTLPWSWCTDTHPVPMIAFHGTEDRVVPYNGGQSWIAPDPFPNIPTWVDSWARRNRCAPDAIDSAVTPIVTRRVYAGCAEDASVELYTIHGGGHEWPGRGGPRPEWLCGPFTSGLDATSVMWAFFRERRLR